MQFPPEDEIPSDLDESEWLRAAATNPAFAFLYDPEEDIYDWTDGTPWEEHGPSADGKP